MRPYFLILITAISFFGCKQPEPVVPEKIVLNGNVREDVNKLLPTGKVTVELMNGIKRDMRLAELQTKYQKGAREHYDWYVEYIKMYQVGQPIPFNKNFGLTPEEYQERQERINKISFYSTGMQELEIIKNDGMIRFNADKKLKDFANITFNLNNNTATIGDYTLQFVDSVNVDNARNGFRSKWKGYIWKYENPKDLQLDDLKNVQVLNAIQYKITLGQLENGNTLFMMKATEVSEGIIVLDVDFPIVF